MAEWDWNQIGSLAAQILPSVVGAIGGGGRGGIGVIPGALQGAGIAAQQNIASEEERRKYNNQLAIQQQNQQFAQQRIDQENRQLEMQSKNYDRMNRVADEQIKNYGLERQKHEMELAAATRSAEGQTRFREQLTPNQQVIFDAAPNKQQFVKDYYEDKDWETKVNGASQMLTRSGLDPEKAKLLGERGTSHLLGQIEEARRRPKDRYAVSYHDGMIIKWDKTDGTFETKEIRGAKDKTASPEKRSQVEKGLFSMWKQQQPAMAKLYEGDDDKTLGAFNSWRSSQEGELSEKFLYQDLTPEEYRGALGSLKRQDDQMSADAMDLMKKAYLGAGANQSEAGFQQYLQTPAGRQNLEAYKKAVKERGRFSNRSDAASEQSKDLEYAEKNKTSLMGRKNAEKEKPPEAAKSTNAKDSLLKDFGL